MKPPRKPTSPALALSATGLSNMSNALQVLAAELPGRTSVRQAMAFVTVAYLNAMNSSVTLTELREIVGADAEGAPLLGQSIDRIFNTFLMPTKRDPDALGWCYQEEDPDDRRKKYLRLTDAGKDAARRITEALAG